MCIRDRNGTPQFDSTEWHNKCSPLSSSMTLRKEAKCSSPHQDKWSVVRSLKNNSDVSVVSSEWWKRTVPVNIIWAEGEQDAYVEWRGKEKILEEQIGQEKSTFLPETLVFCCQDQTGTMPEAAKYLSFALSFNAGWRRKQAEMEGREQVVEGKTILCVKQSSWLITRKFQKRMWRKTWTPEIVHSLYSLFHSYPSN